MRFVIIFLLIISCSTVNKDLEFKLLPSVKSILTTNQFSNINPNEDLIAFSISNHQLPILYSNTRKISIGVNEKSKIEYAIDSEIDLPSEGYTLEILKNKVKITAKDQAGLFYGFITLDQLLEDSKNKNNNLPIVYIEDFPSLKFRPIHLDLKHHIEKKSYYYDLIDDLAKLKVNGIIVEFENAIRSSLGLIFENLLVVEIDLTEGSNLNSKFLFTVEQEMISKNIITNLTTSN